jgi:hypothetical protein
MSREDLYQAYTSLGEDPFVRPPNPDSGVTFFAGRMRGNGVRKSADDVRGQATGYP